MADKQTRNAKLRIFFRIFVPCLAFFVVGLGMAYTGQKRIESFDHLSTGEIVSATITSHDQAGGLLDYILKGSFGAKVDLEWIDSNGQVRQAKDVGLISKITEQVMYEGNLFGDKLDILYSVDAPDIPPMPTLLIKDQTQHAVMSRVVGLGLSGICFIILIVCGFFLMRRQIKY